MLQITELTPELISLAVGFVVSIGFEFVPWIHNWYNKLTDNKQRLVMVGIGAGVVGGAFLLSCLQWFGVSTFTCDWLGGQRAILLFISYLAGNTGTYALFLKKDKSAPQGLTG